MNNKPNIISPFRDKKGICKLCVDLDNNYTREIVADKLCLNCIKYIKGNRVWKSYFYQEIWENKNNLMMSNKMLIVYNYTIAIVHKINFKENDKSLVIELVNDLENNSVTENKHLNSWLQKIFDYYDDNFKIKNINIEKNKINARYLIKNNIDKIIMEYVG